MRTEEKSVSSSNFIQFSGLKRIRCTTSYVNMRGGKIQSASLQMRSAVGQHIWLGHSVAQLVIRVQRLEALILEMEYEHYAG